MTRSLTVVLAAALLLIPQPQSIVAATYCTNCSTEWTQIANKIQLVASYIRQMPR